MTRDIAKGSIKDVAGGDVAIALMNAKIVLLCDRSSSMLEFARDGKCRAEIEDDIVAKFQAKHPGQIALVSFSDAAELREDGVLPYPGGGTTITSALNLAEPMVDIGMRAVLITDGEPGENEQMVIRSATRYKGRMDCIYVGPEVGRGGDFCDRLARAVGGTNTICDLNKEPELLAERLGQLLLIAGGK